MNGASPPAFVKRPSTYSWLARLASGLFKLTHTFLNSISLRLIVQFKLANLNNLLTHYAKGTLFSTQLLINFRFHNLFTPVPRFFSAFPRSTLLYHSRLIFRFRWWTTSIRRRKSCLLLLKRYTVSGIQALHLLWERVSRAYTA